MNPVSGSFDDVRTSVTVSISQVRAFDLFARQIDAWWPRDAHVGKVPMQNVVLEPKLGGRIYERGNDGSECEWGQVLAWEPHTRLIFSWQLSHDAGDDSPISDPMRASEVEVLFVEIDDKQTRVELTHRNFERHGMQAAAIRKSVKAGWPTVLDHFVRKAA